MNLLKRIIRRVFSSVFLATVTFVGAPVAFAGTILAGFIFLPLPASIPLPKVSKTVQASVIYDRYGHPIATLASFDKDIPFTEAQVPSVLKEAVIADEDRNYYHENGIDLRGMARALVADLRNRAPVQGGSTITQQYVKLAYTGGQRTIFRKVKEAILASQLAREASKNDILYHYLTLIYLGEGNYGAAAAAQTYFQVPISRLDVSQAATLAGLIPAPSGRDPEHNLAGAEAARELVLKKMYQQRYLSAAQYAAALKQRLALAGTPAAVPGKATIVYPDLVAPPSAYPDFVDYVTKWLQANVPAATLQAGGLRIQTTLDPATENDMLQVEAATLSGSALPVDMAMVSVEPQTGFVEAMVGGRFFGSPQAGPYRYVNLALGGCPRKPTGAAQIAAPASCWTTPMISNGGGGRQPGSSYKPFTLATAFLHGIPPSTVYSAPAIYQIPGCRVPAGQPASACQIRNDEGGTIGSETLALATAQSTNTVYSQVAEQVGCPNVATTASKLGIQSAYYSTPPFYYCASYALGELGVSPLDMASAYGVFAAHGQRAAPTPILEIVDSAGKVLVDNIHHAPRTQSVLPANVADNVTNVLQGVITNYGTGYAAQLGRPAAGKTGTTSNNTDAWFVGYTPTLSTAVWMGDVDSDAVPVGSGPGCPKGCVTGHYLGGGYSTFYGLYGGEWPAISWKEYMSLALAKVPVTPFSVPAPIYSPQEAAALRAAQSSTTLPPVGPGPEAYVAPTPVGGPYVTPEVPPVAPPPPTAPPPSTTTVPPQETTTTVPASPPTSAGGPPDTTTTTTVGPLGTG